MPKIKPNPEDQKFPPADLAALPHMTDIDRRKCRRVVPMKVLALGVSRTGTFSLRQALVDLGYKDCYHYTAMLQENPRDVDMWLEALSAKYLGVGKPFTVTDWDQLLGHCQAVTDTPCWWFYRELLDAYPDAKVILTVRDTPAQWHRSALQTVVPYYEDNGRSDVGPLTRLYRFFGPVPGPFYRFLEFQFTYPPLFVKLLADYRTGTTTAQAEYVAYNEEIRRIVPADRLLVMNVKEGWGPLCEFLGEEVPLYPFPKVNDTATFQRNVAAFGSVADSIVRWNLLRTVGGVLAVGVALAVGVRRYGGLNGLVGELRSWL